MKCNPSGTKVLTVFAITLLFAACGGTDDSVEEQLRPVRVLIVDETNAARDRTFSGISRSRTESRLSFKVGGTVTRFPVQIGDRLQAGDPIAELDAASYQLQAQQAQAALIEAQANERRATADYERTKGLYANDNASLNDLDAARAQAESARAVVASAQKALEIARLNVSYTRLAADTDCSIAAVDVEVNENVAAGQQVAVVSCGDAYEVRLDLPESVIGTIDRSTPVSVRFGAIPDRRFDGRITEIAVASGSATAAFPVVVSIDGTHPALRSGLAADVTFQFPQAAAGQSSIVLPVAVVINDPNGTFVYVAEPAADGEAVVRRRQVSLGDLTQQGVEVIDGLEIGDRVVTAGITVIRDGQRVLLPTG